MALVTVQELRDFYMGLSDMTDNVETGCRIILEGLQSELEAYLGRPVERRFFVETYQVGAGEPSWPQGSQAILDDFANLFPSKYILYLKQSPIYSVTSVTLLAQGDEVGEEETLVEGDDYTVLPFGLEMSAATAYDQITVTYEAGLDGSQIPAIKTLVLRAAAREAQNMYDDTVGIKDLNPRGVAVAQTGFTPEELKSIRRWRRIRIA